MAWPSYGVAMTTSHDGGRRVEGADTVSFVVQVHCDGNAAVGPFRGRAEHLATGREVRFTTVAGLIEFLRREVDGADRALVVRAGELDAADEGTTNERAKGETTR